MGHVNLPATRRLPRQWRLLDLVTASFLAGVVIFFVLVFTSLGDSLAASGRRALALSSSSDPRQRERIIALFEGEEDPHRLQRRTGRRGQEGGGGVAVIEACSAEEVDHMPCEDPRRNSQLSRSGTARRRRRPHCV